MIYLPETPPKLFLHQPLWSSAAPAIEHSYAEGIKRGGVEY